MAFLWQNLVHQKCPVCNAKLIRERVFFKCRTKDCGFIVGEQRLLEIITDPKTQSHMTAREKEIVEGALKGIGIIV